MTARRGTSLSRTSSGGDLVDLRAGDQLAADDSLPQGLQAAAFVLHAEQLRSDAAEAIAYFAGWVPGGAAGGSNPGRAARR